MMTNAAAKIADGGTAAGHREAKRALGGVNRIVVDMLSKNQGQSQGSGSAMQQLMQQLQQMAREQNMLTDATEELRRQLEQTGMGSEMRQQLADIRARQERLLEETRRLAEEFGDRREILGRLDDTVGEMEGTLAEMERSGASEETIDRQKRILSRLLDAQRSLRRRDYTRERRSRVGEQYARTSPGALPEELTRASEELREDLLRAMQHDYPAEYRALIRAYFDGLARDASTEGGDR
jgi:replicative DNA helicase